MVFGNLLDKVTFWWMSGDPCGLNKIPPIIDTLCSLSPRHSSQLRHRIFFCRCNMIKINSRLPVNDMSKSVEPDEIQVSLLEAELSIISIFRA